MSAYCMVTDLLTGNIPTPAAVDPQKFVQDAADEIDSQIGFVYRTPVDIADSSPVVRPVRLLLKRLNVFLATGRLILAVDGGGEDKQLHAYGLKLIEDALMSLSMIANGQINLEGAPKLPGQEKTVMGPLVSNADSESSVEAFYNRVANPNWLPPFPNFNIPVQGAPPTPFVRGGVRP